MKRGRVIDFTGNADHGVQVYRTGVNLRGAKAAKHQLTPHPYHLTIEERCSLRLGARHRRRRTVGFRSAEFRGHRVAIMSPARS